MFTLLFSITSRVPASQSLLGFIWYIPLIYKSMGLEEHQGFPNLKMEICCTFHPSHHLLL